MYDTATHTRLGKLERPASAAGDPSAPCTLLWRGGRELFACWGAQVWVLRLVGSLLPAAPGSHPGSAPGRSLQIVASFDAGRAALGAAPFGADLAVLIWGPPAEGPGSAGAGAGTAAGAGPAAEQAGVVLPAGATTSADNASAGETSAAASAAAADAAGAAQAEAVEGSGPLPGTPGAAAQQGQGQQAAGSSASAATTSQQAQPLSLSFFSRAGSLLASDALGSSCAAADRRWHQLALLYPGDADLKLAAAASAAGSAWPAAAAATQRRTPAGSAAGSRAGSVPSSGRSSPIRTLSGRRGGAAGSERDADGGVSAGSADGQATLAGEQAALADLRGTPLAAAQQARQAPEQAQQAREHTLSGGGGGSPATQAAAAVQQYKWWRDGEEPLYLVSTPQVGPLPPGSPQLHWQQLPAAIATAAMCPAACCLLQPQAGQAASAGLAASQGEM